MIRSVVNGISRLFPAFHPVKRLPCADAAGCLPSSSARFTFPRSANRGGGVQDGETPLFVVTTRLNSASLPAAGAACSSEQTALCRLSTKHRAGFLFPGKVPLPVRWRGGGGGGAWPAGRGDLPPPNPPPSSHHLSWSLSTASCRRVSAEVVSGGDINRQTISSISFTAASRPPKKKKHSLPLARHAERFLHPSDLSRTSVW